MADDYVKHLRENGRKTAWEFGKSLVTEEAALLTQEEAEDFKRFMNEWIEMFSLDSLPGADDSALMESEQRYHFDMESKKFVTKHVAAMHSDLDIFAFTADLVWDTGAELHLLDWKSGRIVEHIERPESNLQLHAYMLMEWMRRGCPDRRLFIHVYHIRHIHLETVEAFPEGLRKTWDETIKPIIMDWIARSPSQDFPATIGKHCESCRFKRGCEAYLAGGAPVRGETADVLVQIAGAARARADDAEQALRDAVEATGPISSGDFVAEIRTSTTRKWAAGWLEKLLSEIPTADIEKALTPNQEKLRKAYGKHGAEELYDSSMKPFEIPKLKTSINISRKRHVRERTKPGDTYSDSDASSDG